MKRVLTRLAILAIVVVFGAIAIAQAQRDHQNPEVVTGGGVTSAPQTQPPSELPTGYTNAIRDLNHESTDAAFGEGDAQRARWDPDVRPAQAEMRERVSQFASQPEGLPSSAPVRPNPFRTPNDLERGPAPADEFEERFVQPPPLVQAEDTPSPLESQELTAEIASEEPPRTSYQSDFAVPPDGSVDDAGKDLVDQFSSGSEPLDDGLPSELPPHSLGDSYGSLDPPPGTSSDDPNDNNLNVQDQEFVDDPIAQDYVDPPITVENENSLHAGESDAGLVDAGPVEESRYDNSPPEGFPTDEQQSVSMSEPMMSERMSVDSQAAEPMSVDSQAVPPTGRPGPRELEGPQTPSITIQKTAPSEVRVGQPATFQIKVRNVGQVPADNVLVRDEIPQGTRLIDTNPQATRTSDGAIMWQLGTMRPGDEVVASVQVSPVDEGQVGSVATVAFQASASARTKATRPLLEIEHTGPRQVLTGEPVKFSIRLSNPGSGAATQVVLQEDVPPGLAHPKGPQLEYEVGAIQPGGTRHLELTLKAAQPGTVENVLVARAAGGLVSEHRLKLDVIAPQLKVRIAGPSRRYLERKATYSVAVENPGTAPAQNVDLVAHIPRGLKFVSTNNSGRYDPTTHAIRWSLEKLPAGQFGKVQFTATPTAMGQFKLRAEAKANMGLADAQEHDLAVEGIAALLFAVADLTDPIEIGGNTTYEIRVTNQGSKAASNVRFVALVPPGMKPIRGDGPTSVQIDGQRISFEPLARLAPKAESTYRIQVQGVNAGFQRFRVQMTSDETPDPVIKEESTRVYADH